jgi:hypothetical protein
MLATGAISLDLVSSMGLVLDSVSVYICSGESIGDENLVVAWVKTHVLLVSAGSGSVNSGCRGSIHFFVYNFIFYKFTNNTKTMGRGNVLEIQPVCKT